MHGNHVTVCVVGHFNENDISETLRESAKMKDFDHPHVLSMLGVCIDAGPAPYIVMPFMANGSLQSYLRKERANLVLPADTDPDTVSIQHTWQISTGLCVCHHRLEKYRRSWLTCACR